MASDDFKDVDGTTLAGHNANWVDITTTYKVANFRIETNQCQGTTTFAQAGARYSSSTQDTSQIVFKGGSTATTSPRKVCVRSASGNLGYAAYFSTGSGGNFTNLAMSKNGTFLTQVGSLSYAMASDHTLKIVASGTSSVSLQAYVDGTLALTYTDSSSPLGTGNPGFYAAGNGALADTTFDDWTDGVTASVRILNGGVQILQPGQPQVLTPYTY